MSSSVLKKNGTVARRSRGDLGFRVVMPFAFEPLHLQMLPLNLWTLIAALISVEALSSSSPPDLLASPKSSILLTRNLVSNSSATALLRSSSVEGQYKLLRAANGQAFLCSLPSTQGLSRPLDAILKRDVVDAALSKEERKKRSQERIDAGLKKGLSLLEPLKHGCLYYKMGWFTCTSIFALFIYWRALSRSYRCFLSRIGNQAVS